MKETVEILKGERILILVVLMTFLLGILSGYMTFDQSKEEMVPILKNMVRRLLAESKSETAFNIFMNNHTATIMFLVLGVTVILPLIIVLSNGYLFGFILRMMEIQGLDWVEFLKATVPHAIFELPAFFLAAILGMRIGTGVIAAKGRRKDEFIKRTREGIFIFLTVVVPLLLLAAFIEAFITFELVLG